PTGRLLRPTMPAGHLNDSEPAGPTAAIRASSVAKAAAGNCRDCPDTFRPVQAGVRTSGPSSQGCITVSLGPPAQDACQRKGAGTVRWCSRAPKATVALPDQIVPCASTTAKGQLPGITAMIQRAGKTTRAEQQASSTRTKQRKIRLRRLMAEPFRAGAREYVPTHGQACRGPRHWPASVQQPRSAGAADRAVRPA